MKRIIWLSIMLLPYDSFGLIGGHLRPISTPVLFFVFLFVLLNRNQMISRPNVYDHQFYKIIALFVFVSIIGAVKSKFQDFVYNPDGETPVLRLLQFIVFILITVCAYTAGKVASRIYVPIRMLELMLHSFIVPCLFGLIQILTDNHSTVLKISSVISSGVYPEGYQRIWLLFSEPNMAGLYLSSIVIPIVWCAGLLSGWVKYIVFGFACLEVYCTRSLTGYLLSGIAFLVIFVSSSRSKKLGFLPLSLIVTAFVLIGMSSVVSGYEKSDTRIGKIFFTLVNGGFESVMNGDLEGSAASRYISQWAAIRVGLENPLFGVGFRQFGFYYPSLVPDSYFFSQDFRNILFGQNSMRLTDVKSFHLDIFSSCGFIIMLYFFHWQFRVFRKISSLGSLDSKEVTTFRVVFILMNIGGLIAIPMIGLPFIWFLTGYISNASNVKSVNIHNGMQIDCLPSQKHIAA